MSKLTRIIVLLSLAILAASAVSLFGAAKSEADFMGNLNGSVGPNAVISLSTPEGALVSSLGPGTYAIHVTDVATNHNFHLEGAGVNLATSIDATETADWTVDFLDAYYTYRCDRHANLNGSFTSGNPAALVAPAAAPAPAPVLIPVPVATPTPAPAPTVSTTPSTTSGGQVAVALANAGIAGTLKVTLTAKDKLSVTKSGKTVGRLSAGTYKLVVSDHSSRRDVTLRQISAETTRQQLTSRGFTGTRSVSVTLTNGQWKLYSAANEQAVFSFFRVTR